MIDVGFEKAVDRYFDIVRDKCESLINHINISEQTKIVNKYELCHYISSRNIYDYKYDNVTYVFHGSGCTVFVDDSVIADWNFGYRSLWCGIDPFKMALTLKNNNYIDTTYNVEYIKELCEKYASQNDVIFYNYQYYINLLKKGTIKTAFPDDYDELIILQGEKEIKCFKTKIIDRFIRKSREIYKDIEMLDNNILLIFSCRGKEIYRVFYNDMAYPDGAVEIMTNMILKQNMNVPC